MLDYIFSWETLWWLMLILYVPACIGLIAVVLLQKGKGVGFAGAFGAGPGSEAVFGPRTSRSLPQRLTYTMAGVFMVLAFCMSLISGKVGTGAAPALVEEEEIASEDIQAVFGEGGEEDGAAGADDVTDVTIEEPQLDEGAEGPGEGAAATTEVTDITINEGVTENTDAAAADETAADERPAEAADGDAAAAEEGAADGAVPEIPETELKLDTSVEDALDAPGDQAPEAAGQDAPGEERAADQSEPAEGTASKSQ